LRAGGRLAGYVRDLTGSVGDYHTGDIDFLWTFSPKDLAENAGPLPVSLAFDVGLYARQVVTHTLNLVPPTFLPLLLKGSGP
jgi:hypothetical protein